MVTGRRGIDTLATAAPSPVAFPRHPVPASMAPAR